MGTKRVINMNSNSNKFYMDKARQCKAIMQTRRNQPKGSLKDIVSLIIAMESGNYSEVSRTKLYMKHSAEYCEYMEIINRVVFNS